MNMTSIAMRKVVESMEELLGECFTAFFLNVFFFFNKMVAQRLKLVITMFSHLSPLDMRSLLVTWSRLSLG